MGRAKPASPRSFDLHAGKCGLQSRHQTQQHGHDAGMTWMRFRPQPRRQQASAVSFKDQHGMIHVLTVNAVEEAELLLAVSGIVGGIEIEQDLAALQDLVATAADEVLAPEVVQAHPIASRGNVFPTAEGRLGAERDA